MLNVEDVSRIKGFRFSRSVIGYPVWAYHRFALSLRDVEDLLAERGVTISYETIRDWVGRFGHQFAARIRRDRPAPAHKWHLDEVVIRIKGRFHWLWRAVDANGDVLDILVQPKRDKAAAKRFLRKLLKRWGVPCVMVTDKLRSYGAALKELGAGARQETDRWANNRAEHSHLPFRRRERAMLRFRQMRSLQKFATVHASVCNHFNQERSLSARNLFKLKRTAALTEWRGLCALILARHVRFGQDTVDQLPSRILATEASRFPVL